MNQFIERLWYERSLWRLICLPFFLPLTFIYVLVVYCRKCYFLFFVRRQSQCSVPVIVVGNISVGGTGKTPLTLALIRYFHGRGYRVGVISRGYGGKPDVYPHKVLPTDDPGTCGDEPLLISQRTGAPVVIDPDRVAALRFVMESSECDLVISDDGLQHLNLQRDVEIVVVDARRGLGNGWCLPAGPLREPASRLKSVDFVIANGEGSIPANYQMQLAPSRLVAVSGHDSRLTNDFAGKRVHGVAGIGNPERFFLTLEALGIEVIRHAFPDHHRYTRQDIDFNDGLPVIMTEKDAVKCRVFELSDLWYLEVEGVVDQSFFENLEACIQNKRSLPERAGR
ncbi:tetraacyldisaccharide 4'-kinase [Hahella ganghwensis]|uniref:tetraacyldisaccharide 4'-kinase n=1 Tax=Hahella ganghwensis TaxID=286420 RepID=UPI0003686207|nr:tetraacyldisaccharide 4'-kinase [Hahella ganghwensis]